MSPLAHELRDLGNLEPYFGRWVWPLTTMQIGDTFTVLQAHKPFGAVYNYVATQQTRLGRRFLTTREGELTRVTRIPDNADRNTREALRRAPIFEDVPDLDLVDSDPDYMGILKPPPAGENWRWPFAMMHPKNWFLVRHEDKEPEVVRRTAHNLSRLHGLTVSVNVNPPFHRGFTRIEARTPAVRGTEKPVTTYGTMREIIARCYGVDLDKLDWDRLDKIGSWVFYNYRFTVPPVQSHHVFRAEGIGKAFGAHLGNKGLTLEMLDEAWTVFQWMEELRRRELAVDPFS